MWSQYNFITRTDRLTKDEFDKLDPKYMSNDQRKNVILSIINLEQFKFIVRFHEGV